MHDHSSLQAKMMKESNESSQLISGQQVKSNLSLETRFYVRDNSSRWQRPGTVIGQVSQQVFIKHGSLYIRVHPCRMQLIKPAIWTTVSHSSQTNEHDQTKNPTSRDIQPSAMPQNDEDEASRDWIQPQTEKPSNSNAQHYPQQHHHRQQDHLIPPSPADSLLLSTHYEVTPNTNIKFKVNVEDSWNEVTVICRAGKTTGKCPNCWNIKERDGSTKSINLNPILGAAKNAPCQFFPCNFYKRRN